jgi:hypothetical protein
MRFIFLIPFLWFNVASGDVTVNDPNNLLRFIFSGPQKDDFKNDLMCTDTTDSKDFFIRAGRCSFYCKDLACTEKCMVTSIEKAQLQIEDCSDTEAHVYSSLGHDWLLTKADYNQSFNSSVLGIIKTMADFYEPVQSIEIKSVIFRLDRKIIENGKMKNLYIRVIDFAIFEPTNNTNGMYFTLEIDPYRKGLDQIMYLGSEFMTDTDTEYVLKRKGYLSGQ